MSKSNFTKGVSTNTTTVDASNITIGGTSITSTINSIIATNVSEDAQLAGCATIAGNNVFTGSNTIPALTVPSAMTVSSSTISLSQLPRLSSTITPTDSKDLVTKAYTDSGIANIPNLLPANNTWTGTNQFNQNPTVSSDPATNNEVSRKSYVDTKVGAVVGNNNTWTGTNAFNTSLPTSTVTPSSSTQLTTKIYVDSKVGALTANALNLNSNLGSSNTPSITVSADATRAVNVVPNAASSSAYNNIVTAGDSIIYANSNTSNNLVLTQQASNSCGIKLSGATPSVLIGAGGNTSTGTSYINVDGSANTITMSQLPILTSQIVPTDNKHFSTKKYADDSITNLLGANNTFTGTNTFASVSATSVSTPTFTASSSLIAFNPLPIGNSYVTPTDNKQLIQKQYVDTSVSAVVSNNNTWSGTNNFTQVPTCTAIPTNINGLANKLYVDNRTFSFYYGQCTYTSASGDSSFPYQINAPNLGTSTTANSTGFSQVVYLNAPSSLTSGVNTLTGQNQIILQIAYNYLIGATMTGGVSLTGGSNTTSNVLKRATTYLTSEFGATPTSSKNSIAQFNIFMIPNGALTASPISQSTVINTAISNTYGGQTMTFTPVQFQYISNSKLKITIQFPNQMNSPAVSGWIASCGFSALLLNSYDTNSSSGWYFSTA